MIAKKNIIYRVLTLEDLHNNCLNRFDRYQETKNVFFQEENEVYVKEDYFVENWDVDKKATVVQDLRKCVCTNGLVIGAYLDTNLIGFASVEGERFGKNKEYAELSYIHVSRDIRRMGVGTGLFDRCCSQCKKKGVKKLYIGAHPAQETQQFYRNVGCTLAKEIHVPIFEREPLDIQLEKIL